MLKAITWVAVLGYIVCASLVSIYAGYSRGIWLVPAVVGGLSLYFTPISIVLLLGFRKRLSKLEMLLLALPLLVVLLVFIVSFMVIFLYPPGISAS